MCGDEFIITKDGFEEMYQVNYLAQVYLTDLLLPLLRKSSRARIVNTGSKACELGSVTPGTLAADVTISRWHAFMRYADTKLALLEWTRAMAQELKETGNRANYQRCAARGLRVRQSRLRRVTPYSRDQCKFRPSGNNRYRNHHSQLCALTIPVRTDYFGSRKSEFPLGDSTSS